MRPRIGNAVLSANRPAALESYIEGRGRAFGGIQIKVGLLSRALDWFRARRSVKSVNAPLALSESIDPRKSNSGLLSCARAWYRTRQVANSRAGRLQVSETVGLGEKRFVSVIQVNGLRFLVGGSSTNVTLLTQLDDKEQFVDMLQDSLAHPREYEGITISDTPRAKPPIMRRKESEKSSKAVKASPSEKAAVQEYGKKSTQVNPGAPGSRSAKKFKDKLVTAQDATGDQQ